MTIRKFKPKCKFLTHYSIIVPESNLALTTDPLAQITINLHVKIPQIAAKKLVLMLQLR